MKKTIATAIAATLAFGKDQYAKLADLTDDQSRALALLKKGALGVNTSESLADSTVKKGKATTAADASKELISILTGVPVDRMSRRPFLNINSFVAVVAIDESGEDIDGQVMVNLTARINGPMTLADGMLVSGPGRTRKVLRPATEAEIKAFFAQMELFRAEG